LFVQAHAVFEGEHHIRAVLAEPLAVELLDEYRQRRLPWLLAVVVKFAVLPGVQAKFARHLDLLM
jgi:hypothetical protein